MEPPGLLHIFILIAELVGIIAGVVVSIIVGMFLAILVHELGHLVGGLRAGFEFRSLTVGPIEVRVENGRLKWERSPLMRGVAGMVRMVPRGREDLERRLALLIVGGPIASLLWSALTYGLYRAASPFSHSKVFAEAVGYQLAFSALIMGLSLLPGTLIQFSTRSGAATDMKLLLALWGKSEGRSRLVAHMLLAREILSAVRARDWSPELLERALVPEDGSDTHIRTLTLLYYHHLDRGEVEAARAWLAQAHPHAMRLKKGHIMRECVLLETAFGLAWFDGKVDEAARELTEVGKQNELLAGTRSRAEAAVALRMEALPAAEELIAKSEKAVRDMARRYGGNPQLDLDQLTAMRQEIRQAEVGLTGSNTTSMP